MLGDFLVFYYKMEGKSRPNDLQPNEEDQLQMVVKNLLPIYNKHLFA